MGDVGKHLADKFGLDAALGIVRVIDHQTNRFCGLTRPLLLRLAPELPRYRGEYLALVIGFRGNKTVEHVLLAAEKAE